MPQLTNTQKGKLSEDLAKEYLVRKRYEILEMNYRYKRSEIDIIGLKDNLLVFFEVKSRKDGRYGYPEEAVSERKKEMIYQGAENYLLAIKWKGLVRFDIVSVDMASEEIIHFEDGIQ